MKALIKLLSFTVIFFLLANTNLFSQAVTVNGSVNQNYSDLTSAFNAINLGIHGNGNIQVLINQSHTLTTSAILNGGVFASCEIKPTADVTVSGNLSNSLVILDGADNVTIDGRIGLVNVIKLSFLNSIEMKNSAIGNVVKFVSCSDFIVSPPLTNNNSIEDSDIRGGLFFSGGAGLRILRNTINYLTLSRQTKDVDIIDNKVTLWTYIYSIGTINIKGNQFGNTTIIPDFGYTRNNVVNYTITNNFFCKYTDYVCTCLDQCYFEEFIFDFESDHNPDLTANICYNTIVTNITITDLCGIYRDPPLLGFVIGVDVGNVTFKNNIIQSRLNGNYARNVFSIGPAVNYDGDYNCFNFVINGYPHNEPHTIIKNVTFQDVTTCDVHLAGSSIGDNDLKGTHIPGITTDIDNQLRVSPYMGADEADFPLPVELSSFNSSVSNNNVLLNWATASEMNNSGFDVERSEVNGEWSLVNFVKGHGNSNTQQNYSFTDKNLSSGKYKYRLKQIDFNGNFEYFNLSNEVEIGVPDKFSLSQNYPNPFNPTTNLEFGISNLGFVSLKVYNSLGKEVAKLVNEIIPAGRYEVVFDGSNLASGVYFYKLESGSFTAVKKMSLIK